MRACMLLTLPGLNQSLTMLRWALCSSPSIWMSVLTGEFTMSSNRDTGTSVGTGALVKRSGRRSISITSACVVSAQNSG